MLPLSTDVTGLAGIAVTLAAPILAVPGVRRLARPWRALLLTVAGLLVLLPLGTLPLAVAGRGVTGDLSITTLVLVGTFLLRNLTGKPAADSRARFALLAFVSIAALALYPLALGIGMFDPYRLGFGSPWLLGALFAAAIAAWWRRLDGISLCIALATLAWSVRWYESTNLWDYLLDPLVSFFALGYCAVRGAKWILQRFQPARPVA